MSFAKQWLITLTALASMMSACGVAVAAGSSITSSGARAAERVELSTLMADSLKQDANSEAKAQIPPIRAEALREAAASLGARGGLAYRMSEFEKAVRSREETFDRMFNFRALMLDVDKDEVPGVAAYFNRPGAKLEAFLVPAVLTESGPADNYPSDDEMRIAGKIYKIEAREYLSPTAPNWRDYLPMGAAGAVEMPHQSLLPRNEAEKLLWNEWVAKGWEEGVKQAQQMFDAGFSRLERDFHGMGRWRKAYAQGLATRPVVARANLGVTGGGTEMRLNDQIRRITDHSSLTPDQKRWLTSDPE